MASVGQNIPHDSARGHVSGLSVFLDDMPPSRNELVVDVVGSPYAHAKLISIDASDALRVPGVVGVYRARDVPGHNRFGPVVADEDLLVSDVAMYVGHPVAIIAAENRDAIRTAKPLVRIEMIELPPILSIDAAVEAGSFLGAARTISRGDTEKRLRDAEHVLAGILAIGGQEHFYLESQVAIASPGEFGAVTIQSSTQHPTEVQTLVAEALGVPFNHVTCVTKRMGGAFGGKETQAAQPAMFAAIVAARTGRPARVLYDKDDDMRRTGKRHPFKNRYQVGFDSAGTIIALKLEMFTDGGCSTDLSFAVLERAMLHVDNAYYLPNVHITGRICRTHYPSNTAFRGFGGPQAVATIENIIEEIAIFLRADPLVIRRRNLYGADDRNTTPYGQMVRCNTLPELLKKLPDDAHYERRRGEIDAFNKHSRTHLRGMSLTPVKFGISFTRRTLNQANALVNIYTDGTVLVATGATEMGQGVNTRIRQIVADSLGIRYEDVRLTETSTDKNNNTSPTAASSGTDLNGAAAADACAKLRARLCDFAATALADPESGDPPLPEMIRFENGEVFDARRSGQRIRFRELICRAYVERVNLGERGFYATPGVDFDRDSGTGTPFLYFTSGAAISEVMIDRFTGEMRVMRVDLLMDVGRSINPGIDRGQITGGFVQGMGWVTTEELKYSPAGVLLSHSPTTYKIPAITDVPTAFNIELLEHDWNDVGLLRSKALGEPPLLLAVSVWTAVKNALSYVSGSEIPNLELPATTEQILSVMTRHRQTSTPVLTQAAEGGANAVGALGGSGASP
jgi:xanthine dehydrogenase large subunit